MAFDPDSFLAEDQGFSPDAFLSEGQESTGSVMTQEQLGIDPATIEQKEAPFMAQVGRGMVDVYEGATQFLLNVGDFYNNYEERVDQQFTPGSLANKAAKSLAGAISYLVPEVDADSYNKQVSNDLRIYNQNNPDIQVGRILGSIATPLTIVPGGSAATLGGKILTGAATGSVFSLAQPVESADSPDEFWAQKMEQALWGAGFGAGIPVAGKILGYVGNWFDELTKPLYKHGIHRDISKFLRENLDENKDKIEKAIQRAIDEGDERTVGQIIADATRGTGDDFGGKLVRLEKDLARESDALKSLYARQTLDKTSFLDNLAGSKEDLARAVAARARNGEANYKAAFRKIVRPDAELKEILNNKFAKDAMKKAQDVLRVGAENQNAPLAEGLHLTKLGLDAELAKSGDLALSKAQKKAVVAIKDRLVKWMEDKNPAYLNARETYQIESIPINRMKVGKEIRDSFIGALEDKKPSTFANALRNSHRILKRATGESRYESLDKVFSSDEVARLGKIADDLSIEQKAKTMARESISTIGKVSGEVELSLPHILSRPIVITNHFLDKMGQDKSGEYRKLLIQLAQDPDEFLRHYKGSGENPATKMAVDIVRRINTMIAAQQSARLEGAE